MEAQNDRRHDMTIQNVPNKKNYIHKST